MISTNLQYLYKYGSINEYSESLFSTNKIYLARAEELNDPFECRPFYTFEGEENEIVGSYANGALSSGAANSRAEAIEAGKILYQAGHHLSQKTWDRLREKSLDMSTKRIGIYCLSEVPDEILMWSHYAASHRGYCIEFEANDSTPIFGEAQQVKYRSEYPAISHFKMSSDEKLERAFLRKYAGWEYEKEWRVLNNVSGPGPQEYPAVLMKRVIFGMAMTDTHKGKIREWTKRRGHTTTFAQAVRDNDKFAIRISPVS